MTSEERLLHAPWFFLRTLDFWHRRYPRDTWWCCIRIAWAITEAMLADWEEYPCHSQ
jgi:hypothetical protein